jgi:predicted metalloprotease with PDZ domain
MLNQHVSRMDFLRQMLSFLLLLCFCSPTLCAAGNGPAVRLEVDARDAARNIFHVKEMIPVRPGPFTVVYPKWIPGNHRPSGPIASLTGLHFEAGGKPILWQRDAVDMYAFHVNVPPGTHDMAITFDQLMNSDSAGATGAASTSELLDLNWNQVVLYPEGANSDAVQVVPSVRLPEGWSFGTALRGAHDRDHGIEFGAVSLTTLVDSPLIAGRYYRQIALTASAPVHVIDLVGESEASLQMSNADVNAYQKLVDETGELFGARHYSHYDFLLTLSDEAGHHGVEHHESSDNSVGERMLKDPSQHLLDASLLPHEFVHSWNGKYRRPAGLATGNYQEPMIGELLWVYEGLTDYLGNVLAARAGLWTDEQYREHLALTAAEMDYTAGRSWRPLEDTARSVQILRLMGPRWESWRRSLDYYPEGDLIWLEVDTKIRQLTRDKRSLDDFCRNFHGSQSGPPRVVPYTFDDVVKALNNIASFDWARLLRERVDATSSHAPLAGIEQGGWRLVYSDKPNRFVEAEEKLGESVNLIYSLGFWVKKDGEIVDVVPGSPAYKADLGPGMKLVAVNGRKWSREVLHDAIRAAQKDQRPLELIVENKQFFKTCEIAYHNGEKYPHLVPIEGQPDLLSQIVKARSLANLSTAAP